ncbi:hypothetical protein EJB05_07167, partial [Eragrostis curvula]
MDIKGRLSIPTRKDFVTRDHNQRDASFPVYEGEGTSTEDNYLLGTFKISGLPPAPKGAIKFEVTFDIDANGVLKKSILSMMKVYGLGQS